MKETTKPKRKQKQKKNQKTPNGEVGHGRCD